MILNRVSGARHEGKLRAAIERFTRIPVLGAIGEDPRLGVVERHLGLIPASEAGDAQARVAAMREAVCAAVDLDAILAIARTAAPVPAAAAGAAGPRFRRCGSASRGTAPSGSTTPTTWTRSATTARRSCPWT